MLFFKSENVEEIEWNFFYLKHIDLDLLKDIVFIDPS